MDNYVNDVTGNVPQKITQRKAYLIGGGIASMAAAAYLIRDCHMPGENITIYEELDRNGGAMDGNGNPVDGYSIRGGREIESHYENFCDLFSIIPSIDEEGKTVLDEFVELNQEETIESHCRITKNQGAIVDTSSFKLSKKDAEQLVKLHLATEESLGDMTIREFFDKSFFQSNFWKFWSSMFAFEEWHSVAEMRRYENRFMHLIGGMNQLIGILHTRYNQYDSLILPLQVWLDDHHVNFKLNTEVTEVKFAFPDQDIIATEIDYVDDKGCHEQTIQPDDIVLLTNGSMTENTNYGDLDTPTGINYSTERGVFSIWDRIAPLDERFGHPEKFDGHIPKSKWLSFTITLKDDDIVVPYIEKVTQNKPGMNGVTTIEDSSWFLNWAMPRDPHYRGQPDDIKVIWADVLYMDNEGDYIHKKPEEATGRELWQELIYHMGLSDHMDEILEHTVNVIPASMPYITAHFMPRVAGDRPKVVPDGSKNFGFIGQYAETTAKDTAFTVEYSIRSAREAVYTLLDSNKEVEDIYQGQYDIRVLSEATKKLFQIDHLPVPRPLKEKLNRTTLKDLL